jgi:(E)-4-hydroxy-3-methylbut-2-enyl-diphosphate synthase
MSKKNKREITVGYVKIGADNPVRVQSMTNTKEYKETLSQVNELADAGCELVRISVPEKDALESFLQIKNQVKVPLIADIHFDHELACECLNRGVECVRINPGNIGGKENTAKVINAAKVAGSALRIGVNAGSLEKDLLEKFGGPTPQALVESAIRWIDFTESLGFLNFKVSIKTSKVEDLIIANRELNERTSAPIHIGVTEAGTLIGGVIRSTLGLSELLKDGIGDTIRISLSADPVNEAIAGWELLKQLGLRTGVDIISCPTCARTGIDVIGLAYRIQKEFGWVNAPVKVAVMGCIVNGPGEAREADIGIAGGKDCAALFIDGKIVKKVSQEEALNEISRFINSRIIKEEKK